MSTKTTEKPRTLSIAIDTERIIAALIDSDGTLSSVNALPNPISESRDEIVHTIISLAKQTLLDVSDNELLGIGVVLPAFVDHEEGLVLESEQLPQLEGLELANILQDALDYPVIIENDINAMALLEAHTGAGQKLDNIFYIFLDNNINGVIIQDGRIWRGTHSKAVDIASLVADWMGPKTITLGQRTSGQGIASDYSMRSRHHRTPDVDELLQYARQGDNLAIRVIRDAARIFGSVLSPAINLIDPELIVVGGRFAHTGDLWWSNFLTAFNDASNSHQIVPSVRSHYDEDATLQAAALIAQIATRV